MAPPRFFSLFTVQLLPSSARQTIIAPHTQEGKRVVRFLKGLGKVQLRYPMQSEEESRQITTYVDSDWAGCTKTRRSTSGGVMKVGRHVLRTWSSTQPTIATSSGEAELIAISDGAARSLGMKTVMTEMGINPTLKVLRMFTDSSVAKSFVSTRGLGQRRCLDVKLLWLQECVQTGRFSVGRVSGATNVADALTKYHDVKKLRELCDPHGICSGPDGGSTIGPRGV